MTKSQYIMTIFWPVKTLLFFNFINYLQKQAKSGIFVKLISVNRKVRKLVTYIMLSRKIASQLKGLETPFYLYDINLLRQTLESVVYESNKYNYKVHYAIKANNDDYLLSIIKEYGIGIDCASGNEVRKAIESGFEPKSIVYAGVGKRDKEIRYAIEQNILAINCESIEELQVVNTIAAELGKKADIGLRINPDFEP